MASALTVASVQTKIAAWNTEYDQYASQMDSVDPQKTQPIANGKSLMDEIRGVQRLFTSLDTNIWKEIAAIDSLSEIQKPAFADVRETLSAKRKEISKEQTTLNSWHKKAKTATKATLDPVLFSARVAEVSKIINSSDQKNSK